MLRVLKHGGILYLAVPDKRYTFDIDRPVTTIEHLLQDYEQGPQWSKRQHFEEWSRFIDKIVDRDEVEKRVTYLMNIDYSIHCHVWTQMEFLELVIALKRRLDFKFNPELFFSNQK